MRYKELDYWVSLARRLEEGFFDGGIFFADVLGVYDVYGGGRRRPCAARCRCPSTTRPC